MKTSLPALVLSLGLLSMGGCAVTSGLQTYDLPQEGTFQTEQGTVVNVVPITQANLHEIRAVPNFTTAKQGSTNVEHLFRSSQAVGEYRLSAFDVLSIYLWAYPEITPPTNTINNTEAAKSNGYQIDASGYIELPLVGRYKAAGKTVAQINKELRNQFARYLKQPDVIVRVLSYEGKSFSVQGNVNKGGQFFLNNKPVSVYAALGMAGGVTATGDNTLIQLVRDGITYQLNPLELEKSGYSLHNLLLKAQDTIYVPSKENSKIYVMGESGKNQSLNMREQGMTLSDALGESQGINPNSASAKRIYVVRTNPHLQETTLYSLDLMSLGNFGLANQFQLNANDIIYVDATGLTRWQRVINQVVPFSNALYSFQRLGQ